MDDFLNSKELKIIMAMLTGWACAFALWATIATLAHGGVVAPAETETSISEVSR